MAKKHVVAHFFLFIPPPGRTIFQLFSNHAPPSLFDDQAPSTASSLFDSSPTPTAAALAAAAARPRRPAVRVAAFAARRAIAETATSRTASSSSDGIQDVERQQRQVDLWFEIVLVVQEGERRRRRP